MSPPPSKPVGADKPTLAAKLRAHIAARGGSVNGVELAGFYATVTAEEKTEIQTFKTPYVRMGIRSFVDANCQLLSIASNGGDVRILAARTAENVERIAEPLLVVDEATAAQAAAVGDDWMRRGGERSVAVSVARPGVVRLALRLRALNLSMDAIDVDLGASPTAIHRLFDAFGLGSLRRTSSSTTATASPSCSPPGSPTTSSSS